MGKKGQEMSISTIILIVLAILVLVVLIIGFTSGWQKILPFINPPNNVQQIAEICALKCATKSQFDFCTQTRKLTMEKETADSLNLEKNTITASCNELTKYAVLGIEPCSGLCPALVTCKNLGGTWKPACADVAGTTPAEQDLTLQVTDFDGRTSTDVKCCK